VSSTLEDDIDMGLRETGFIWLRYQWEALTGTVMKPQVPESAGDFLNG
jgi:hypothetical protein